MNEEKSVRLDQWLWAARFYKTRSLAKAAIESGKILVNGQRAKPARNIQCGDRLHIDKHREQIYDIVVEKCENKRVSSPLAQTFYQETANSIANRRLLQAQQQAARDMVQYPVHRPDKRERRQIRAFRHQKN
ncbi:MAG: S4 domain-containing protein [Cardiobacteriaceae bacterium]|nr:S4 domain-containing protein [Cardiobacteriaceae bacterium]